MTQDKVDRLAELLNEAIPLTEELIADEKAADDRERLREQCGQWGVFLLKNNLAALCSETARNSFFETPEKREHMDEWRKRTG